MQKADGNQNNYMALVQTDGCTAVAARLLTTATFDLASTCGIHQQAAPSQLLTAAVAAAHIVFGLGLTLDL
jgi:hypothetical protein